MVKTKDVTLVFGEDSDCEITLTTYKQCDPEVSITAGKHSVYGIKLSDLKAALDEIEKELAV